MEESERKRGTEEHCCISHEFFKAASKHPNKVAVIQSSGGAPTAKELRHHHHANYKVSNISVNEGFTYPLPPVYEGDQCYTFGYLLASVDSLSSRLRIVLDGGDDPCLIRPPGHFNIERSVGSGHFHRLQQPNEPPNMDPKILGIYMVPSVEYIIAVLSVLRCGDAFLPLDPSWPKERILSIVSSSNIDLIICCKPSFDESARNKLGKTYWLTQRGNCSVLSMSLEVNLQEFYDSLPLVWPCENRKLLSFCYLMYTSGSTGKPKGVCGTEQGLLNRYIWMQQMYPLHGEEYLLFKTGISFIDHLQEFLGAILSTCILVIPPVNQIKENLSFVVDILQAYSINRLTAVPSLMRAILPSLESPHKMRVQSSLKLLVLSGEVLPLSFWEMLSKLLPNTCILNLYGSTEVSGDCTYFDCRRLPMMLETETLSSVPIGLPISNCNVILVGENGEADEGEIYVGGKCMSLGYLPQSAAMPLEHDQVLFPQKSTCNETDPGGQIYFRTGDFARRLQSGDLVFLGRKDRILKVNGQRVALEEIENLLREHPDVVNSAVISSKGQGRLDFILLKAFLIVKQKNESSGAVIASVRSWMVERVPSAMVPNLFFIVESFPISSTGKIDYATLASSTTSSTYNQHDIGSVHSGDLLHVIRKAFCDTLMVEKVSDDDDFFMMGGNSIVAAHCCYTLGIDLRLLYAYRSPYKLQMALQDKDRPCNFDVRMDATEGVNSKGEENIVRHFSDTEMLNFFDMPDGRSNNGEDYITSSKCLKVESNLCRNSGTAHLGDGHPWNSKKALSRITCSFSRCNKVFCAGEDALMCQEKWLAQVPKHRTASMTEIWKVHLASCVDASPLIVLKDQEMFLFIGSHSHKFLCINAKSGSVWWEINLEGRIECSAAVLGDFSQVVVGCYKGKIYFLDFSNGTICWTFQTCGEVKSQPVIDSQRHLAWCGSYDHNLYALDYEHYCCIYKFPCGGSIYGSPAIDQVHDTLYVASTSGRVTAISLKVDLFSCLWLHELRVPVFGSLSITSSGYVICCMVDGHVVSLDSSGSVSWMVKTGGPIFAGASISSALPSQVLICSRNGSVYSYEMEKGELLWEYSAGNPITASAYVDENLRLVPFEPNHSSDRLICICSSSGSIHLLKICMGATQQVQEFARLDLQGDVFSSPVMISGRIFVGCRDDYVHCIGIEALVCERPADEVSR